MLTYDKKPTDWILKWAANTGTGVVTIEDAFRPAGDTTTVVAFPELNPTEADPATGDIANIWFAMCHQMYKTWVSIPYAERPDNWSLTKSSYIDPETDLTTVTFSAQFITKIDAGAQNVMPNPVTP